MNDRARLTSDPDEHPIFGRSKPPPCRRCHQAPCYMGGLCEDCYAADGRAQREKEQREGGTR